MTSHVADCQSYEILCNVTLIIVTLTCMYSVDYFFLCLNSSNKEG